MTRSELVAELLKLNSDERMQAAEQLWQSLTDEAFVLSDAQMEEIERRMEEHERDPSTAVPGTSCVPAFSPNLDNARRASAPSGRRIDRAASWYEQEHPGLGNTFVQAVTSAFSVIANQPSAFPQVGRGARRFIVHRFPYVIIYRLKNEAVVVYACIHSHRDPERWRERL